MKKIISSVIISILFLPGIITAQESNTVTAASDMAIASWDKTEADLGTLKQNEPVEAVFVITNNGKTPLIIKDVRASCGCTVTSYTKEPVLPGNSTSVKAGYDAKSLGNFNKSITVSLNTAEGIQVLRLKGTVK